LFAQLSAFVVVLGWLLANMSSTAARSAYWRVAGMSYLKYTNLCATMVRDAMKEPLKEAAKARELVYFKEVQWRGGKPASQGAQSILGYH
jgi:F-type H+-transporting ATPase subunit epsilon